MNGSLLCTTTMLNNVPCAVRKWLVDNGWLLPVSVQGTSCKNLFCFICLFYLLFFYPTDPEKGKHYQMTSFVENRIERFVKNRDTADKFVTYSRKQFSRVYPKGQRMDSSNYDPSPMWCAGSQLVALNYQTPGMLEDVCEYACQCVFGMDRSWQYSMPSNLTSSSLS